MNEAFPEPLKQYWVYEVARDEDIQDLFIVSDIAHALQACGYPESLAEDKALEIFFKFVEAEKGSQ